MNQPTPSTKYPNSNVCDRNDKQKMKFNTEEEKKNFGIDVCSYGKCFNIVSVSVVVCEGLGDRDKEIKADPQT